MLCSDSSSQRVDWPASAPLSALGPGSRLRPQAGAIVGLPSCFPSPSNAVLCCPRPLSENHSFVGFVSFLACVKQIAKSSPCYSNSARSGDVHQRVNGLFFFFFNQRLCYLKWRNGGSRAGFMPWLGSDPAVSREWNTSALRTPRMGRAGS